MFENSRFDSEIEMYEGVSNSDYEITNNTFCLINLASTEKADDEKDIPVTSTYTIDSTNKICVISTQGYTYIKNKITHNIPSYTNTLYKLKKGLNFIEGIAKVLKVYDEVSKSIVDKEVEIGKNPLTGNPIMFKVTDANVNLSVESDKVVLKVSKGDKSQTQKYKVGNGKTVNDVLNFINSLPSQEFETDYFFGKKKLKDYDVRIKPEGLQIGDIILSTTREIDSAFIRILSGSKFSHSMLYVGNGEIIEALLKTGVKKKPLSEALRDDKYAYVLRLPNLSPADTQTIKDYAIAQEGKKFDKAGLVKTGLHGIFRIGKNKPNEKSELKFFCSELIATACQRANIKLFDTTQFRPSDYWKLIPGTLDCIGYVKSKDDKEFENTYEIENELENGVEYFDIPFFGPSAADIRREILIQYYQIGIDTNKITDFLAECSKYLAGRTGNVNAAAASKTIQYAYLEVTTKGIDGIPGCNKLFEEALSQISKADLTEIKKIVSRYKKTNEFEYSNSNNQNNNTMENNYYLESDPELDDEFEDYEDDEYEDYEDYEEDEYEDNEAGYDEYEDDEAENEYAERLNELANESFESEYELEAELDSELETMQEAYFETPLKEEHKKRKRRRRRPRGRHGRHRRKKGKGLLGKILKVGGGVLSKLPIPGVSTVGNLMKAGSNLVTGDFKGMAKDLAKGALNAIPIPGAGTIGGAVLDAVAPDEGGEGEVRRRRRRVARRVAKITRDGFKELRDNLPDDLEDREAVYEASKQAMRRAMAKNGVRPQRPELRKNTHDNKGNRRVITLKPGERLVIVNPK